MPHVSDITDADDPRIADYVDLADPDLRRRVEAERGYFVAESPLVVRALLASGRRVRSVLVTPKQYDAMREILDAADVPLYVAPPAILRRVVGFDLHRGAVAAADRWPLPPVAGVLHDARRILVLEKVNDHENLGVLFRNAAAFGIDAVLLDAECSDPLYRRTVRVSIGHVLHVAWTRIASLDDVRSAGFELVALTPAVDAVDIGDVVWPVRTALLLGAEGPGLSAAWLDAASIHTRIPMRGHVDSLNVATAAAIVGRDPTMVDLEPARELDLLEQRPVVGDEEERPVEARQRLLELLDGGDVEVVRGLVEDEAVDAPRTEECERRASAFARRQRARGASDVLRAEAELREQ
jgi:tRNA G18 (ribose-2'-O)-methylase SpoU